MEKETKKQNQKLSKNELENPKNLQKDKTRLLSMTIVVIFLTLALILFAITISRKGNIGAGIGSVIIALIILIFAAVVIKRKYTSIKKGFPIADERTKKIEVLAGYYTFLISIWYLLALSYLSDNLIQFKDPSQALSMGILGMAIIFGVCWLYLSIRGKTE